MQKQSKQKTVILDSSVWVSLIIENDSNHQKAKKIFNDIKVNNFKIILPDIVFYEVVTVLLKLNCKSFIPKFLSMNLNLSFIPPKNFLYYILRYEQILVARTSDFLILIYCMHYNVNQFETFDHKQKRNYQLIQDYEKKS